MANPYTAVAAVLQAALLGVENGYDLQATETGDGFVKTDATVGAATDLKSAIQDLAADTALGQAVGAVLVENHMFMKEAEVEKTEGLDAEALRDFYIFYI